MRRARRRLFNLFAFSLLAFAIYLNFFYKEDPSGLLRSGSAEKQSTNKSSADQASRPHPAVKK